MTVCSNYLSLQNSYNVQVNRAGICISKTLLYTCKHLLGYKKNEDNKEDFEVDIQTHLKINALTLSKFQPPTPFVDAIAGDGDNDFHAIIQAYLPNEIKYSSKCHV